MLVALVQSALWARSETPVTITIDGVMLSGFLISGHTYYASLQDILAQEGSMGAAILSNHLQASLERNPLPPGDAVPADTIPELFYLRDTVRWSGNTLVPVGRWCGRYADISGWMLGAPSDASA